MKRHSSRATRPVMTSMMSFTLMGALVGLFVGAIDATSAIDAGLNLLLGATGLHVLAGSSIGLLIGAFYGFLPSSLRLSQLIEELRAWLLPERSESVYHRGRVLGNLWGVVLLFPPLSNLLIKTMSGPLERIRSPLFSSVASALALFALFMLLTALTRSLSSASARFLSRFVTQFRRVYSLFPALLHTLVVLASLYAFALILPQLAGLAAKWVKLIKDPIWAASAASLIAFLFVGSFGAGVTLLSGARYEGILNLLMRSLRFFMRCLHPSVHLGFLIGFLMWQLFAWAQSGDPSWDRLALRPTITASAFLFPLLLGGEYLQDYVKNTKKLWIFLILSALWLFGMSGAQAGIGEEKSRAALNERAPSSKLLLSQLRWLLDDDGDGFADALGDGDCDDEQATIYPGGEEIYGNDIDEDCDGIVGQEPEDDAQEPPEEAPIPLVASAEVPARRRADPPIRQLPLEDRIRRQHNLLLITIANLGQPQTRWADELPTLNGLLQEAQLFERGYLTSPREDLSVASLLTGRYPSELHRIQGQQLTFAPSNITLARVLERHHYQTSAYIQGNTLPRSKGLYRGFDLVELGERRSPERLLAAAAERLTEPGEGERRFIWVHLRTLDSAGRTPTRGQIRSLERAFAGFYRRIKQSPRWPATALLLAGVGSSEPSRASTMRLPATALRTTIALRLPEEPPRRMSVPMSIVYPSSALLQLAKVNLYDSLRGGMGLKGDQFLHAALGDQIRPLPVYAEALGADGNLTRSTFFNDELKLLIDEQARRESLYDLTQDPREERSLTTSEPLRFEELSSARRRFLERSLESLRAVGRRGR